MRLAGRPISRETPSGVLLRETPCRSEHERSLAVCLHLDDAGGVPEDRDLFPQNPRALLQLQAPTVDREPGDVVPIGSRVAEVLPILEAHVKKVEVSRSLTDAAARPAELSQQRPYGPVLCDFTRGDVFARRRAFCLRNGLPHPQVKHAQWLGRGVFALVPDDTSRFHPCEARCGEFAPLPGLIL